MPCIRARAASGASGRSGVSRPGPTLLLGEPVLDPRGARVVEALHDRDADEAIVAGQILDGEGLPHAWVSCSLEYGVADGARAGDAAGRQQQLLELGLVVDRPLHLVVGLDERLQHHLAVAPVLELVRQGELERPDGGGVGDGGRVVEVVRVRRDLAPGCSTR